MDIEFNADEIFEMAEQIERNGALFYRKAAQNNAENPEGVKMLNVLANMEDDHERTFARLREKYSEKDWSDSISSPDNETALYLQAIADGHVFNIKDNPVQKLTGNESLEEILRTAIELEEDSIVFYLGMKDMVPEAFGKDSIDLIIKEEKGHIVILSKFLRSFE